MGSERRTFWNPAIPFNAISLMITHYASHFRVHYFPRLSS
jgi:hypothetical protein